MMNPDTHVAICCYQGDAVSMGSMMGLYAHHGCPVTVLSPEDSPVLIPGVDCRAGGKRAYIGQDCLDRMRIHFQILLNETSENHFLIHDADSICLSPKIPSYLYAEPDVLWSNRVDNGIIEQQAGFPADIPHVAFQPPWFLSRATIAKILAAPAPIVNPILPFIDYWLVETAVRHGIPWKPLRDAISAPLSHGLILTNRDAIRRTRNEGLIFLHSIKGIEAATPYIAARMRYVTMHGDTQ